MIKATPHIEVTESGKIAKTVLMPGDPLRAKFIAENFLEDVEQFNSVRGMLGFTGTYKGHKVSVMGSGMGMPSIGIYSYELYKYYDVENIIRIGSAGSYKEDLKLYDVVLVDKAYSESSFVKAQTGLETNTLSASSELNNTIKEASKNTNINLIEGTIHSSDVFYHENDFYMEEVINNNCLACEMESFALFQNAKIFNKNASCIVTISDNLVTKEETTSEQREKGLNDMILLALESTILIK